MGAGGEEVQVGVGLGRVGAGGPEGVGLMSQCTW